jgi:hypothetical protein
MPRRQRREVEMRIEVLSLIPALLATLWGARVDIPDKQTLSLYRAKHSLLSSLLLLKRFVFGQ